MYSPSGHPICRWVCLFFRTDLEKCSITSLAHQWMLCSEWVPSEWESKQMIKTLQSSTSNPHHSRTSVNVLWSQKLKLANPSLRRFSFKWVLFDKIWVHNNAFSSEKVHPLLFSHIKIHRHICLELFWTVFVYKHCLICAYFSPDSDEIVFIGESNVMDKGLVF